MEIQVKCRLQEKHLEMIRKYANLTEKSDDREVYSFMNVTAVIENMIATISMLVKKEKDIPKAQKKLLSMVQKFGLEVC